MCVFVHPYPFQIYIIQVEYRCASSFFHFYITFYCSQLPKVDEPSSIWNRIKEFSEQYKKDNPGSSKGEWILVEVGLWYKSGKVRMIELQNVQNFLPKYFEWNLCRRYDSVWERMRVCPHASMHISTWPKTDLPTFFLVIYIWKS